MKKIQGIYIITNNKTGNFYIGSSGNIKQRMSKHFYKLRKNEHENSYLQNSFNKHGEQNFSWSVLHAINEDSGRLQKETLLLEKLHDNQIMCFNINQTAHKTGRVKTKEGLEKLKENGRRNCKAHWSNPDFVKNWRSKTQTPDAIKKRCDAAKKSNSKPTCLRLYDKNNHLLIVNGSRTEIAKHLSITTSEASKLILKQCSRVKNYTLAPKIGWCITNGEKQTFLYEHQVRKFTIKERIGSYSHFKEMLNKKRKSYCNWRLAEDDKVGH